MKRGTVGKTRSRPKPAARASLSRFALVGLLLACQPTHTLVEDEASGGEPATGGPRASGGASAVARSGGGASTVVPRGAAMSGTGGAGGSAGEGSEGSEGGEAGMCLGGACVLCPAGFFASEVQSPKCVPKAVQIASNSEYSCALFGDASVKCWGRAGTLGDGSPIPNGVESELNIGDDERPSSVEPLLLSSSPDVKVIQVEAGEFAACAVFSDGSLKCWGDGSWGELGRGNRDSAYDAASVEPVSVSRDPNETVVQVAVGQSFACALLSTGKVKCWGTNQGGELGRGHLFPVPEQELPSDMAAVSVTSEPGVTVVQLAAATFHVCALLSNGAIKCWGENAAGQLGTGDRLAIGDDELPSSMPDVRVSSDPNLTAIQVVTEQTHSCALLSDHSVRCWGNPDGLGYPPAEFVDPPPPPAMQPPVQVAPPGAFVTSLSVGHFYTCAALSDGSARCWGRNTRGQLGYGNTNRQSYIGDNETPVSAGPVPITSATDIKVVSISAGADHACAVLSDGSAKCWGNNYRGALGYGHRRNIGDDEQPSSVGAIRFYD